MPRVWCSISAHGFGHAAQVIPIINALGTMIEELHVVLRTGVQSSIFEEYLQVPWELQAVQQDIGCIQRGPIDIDIENTWETYEKFHEHWNQRVAQEAEAMTKKQPDLVISNISYLAIASAFQAKFPAVAIASLSWDQVLKPFMDSSKSSHQRIYNHIQQEYAKANHLIRLHPAISMPAFISTSDTGPSFPLAKTSLQNVRRLLGLTEGETLVLVGFGGVPLEVLPLHEMESCEGLHFLVSGVSLELGLRRIHRVEELPLSFAQLLSQVDVIVTKPGYATITAAVHYGIPVVYVRRYNFVDESPLVEYVHKYGRAVELSRETFESGCWEEALETVLRLPVPPKDHPYPEPQHVAGVLKEYFRT